MYCSSSYKKKLLCFGRATATTRKASIASDQSWAKRYARAGLLEGRADFGTDAALVNATVSHDGKTATVTLSGPAGAWFGVGFGATSMADAPYALIVDGAGAATERRLVNHGPGSLLAASVTVKSSVTVRGVRTVVLTRPVAGATTKHYSFPTSPGQIDLITAIGNTPALAYHKARTGARMVLLPTESPACVCKPTTSKYLTYMNTSTQAYGTPCADEPRSDMLRHGDGTGRDVPNMACEMETYHGGLHCCQHHYFLTDVEQDSLIPAPTDVYFLKWRYVKRRTESTMVPVIGSERTTNAPVVWCGVRVCVFGLCTRI